MNAEQTGLLIPAMQAVQAVALLALDPPPAVADTVRATLREQAGLEDSAIDRLVDQARSIMAGEARGEGSEAGLVTLLNAVAAPDLHCDHCGRRRHEAASAGSTQCAPPFTVRPHSWTGRHPADKAKAPQ